MYQTSEAFNSEILNTSRRFKARITVDDKTYQDEILTIVVNLGSCGDTAFSFGTVFSSYAEIALIDIGQLLAEQEMFVEIGLYLPDGTIEYVPFGYFTASSPNIARSQGKITLKASDRMTSCQISYVPRVSFPAKIADVLSDISAQTGVTITTTLNTTGTITIAPESRTCMEMIGYIAGLLGGFCYVDCAGIIKISAFPSTVTRSVEERVTIEHSFEESVYRVGKISVSVGDDAETVYTESDDVGNAVSVENPFMTETLFSAMKANLMGYSYNPGEISFLGDQRLDASDVLSIVIDESEKRIPCMNIVHDFDGGLTTTVTAPGRTTSDEQLKGPLQIQVEKAQKAAEQAKTKANLAEEVSNQAKQQAESAKSAADDALASAGDAQTKADSAVSDVEGVKKNVAEITETVTSAKAAADNAQKAASTAQEDAATAKTSAANAEKNAADAKTAAEAAGTKADNALTSAGTAEKNASDAKTTASEASKTAAAAKEDAAQAQKDIDNLGTNLTTLTETLEADYARKTELSEAEATLKAEISKNAAEISSTVSKVTKIDETANNAADLAATAQSKAEAAQTAADNAASEASAAQTKADEAAQAAQTAQSNADTAKAAADNAQSVADKANTDLAEAKKNLATVKDRVDATEEDITKAQEAVTTAQAAADKAQSDASAAATKASEAQTVADAAKTSASAAQTTANQASAKAEAAQTVANEAKTNASDAQTKAAAAVKTASEAQTAANNAAKTASEAQSTADTAKANAEAAQTAADDAKAKSDQAAADLVTAKKNLEEVSGRVDSTAEEVEAAKTAVATAQAAADKAKTDAAAAQSTADTAKANAATAQTAADNAKTAASNAQKAADDAQAAADKAQEDVNALTKRVTTAETSIKQNSEEIALRATKTEVTEAADAALASAKTYADAQIKISAEGINQNVTKVQEASITSSQEQFYQSTSPTSLAGGSWSTTQPAWADGKYIWRRTLITYGDGKTAYTPSSTGVCITGNTGAKGSTGTTGSQWYSGTAITGTSTTATIFSGSGITSARVNDMYLNTSTGYTYKCTVAGAASAAKWVYAGSIKGATGSAGKGVKSTAITYQASSSGTTVPTGTWATTPPSVSAGQYLWTQTVFTYTDSTTSTVYSVGRNGTNGTNGKDGAAGKGIKSYAITYQASTSGTTIPTGTWSTSIPTVAAGSYLWTRTIITYTDDTTSTSYSIGKMGNTGATGAQGKPGIDLSQGKMLYTDPFFLTDVNSLVAYNNSANGNVTITRAEKSSDNPITDASHEIVVKNVGSASPGIGGVVQRVDSRANAVFVRRIIAKIPTGRNLKAAENSMGTGYKIEWLTSQAGTGKFTEYMYKYTCGASGTFSNGGHMYLDGSAGTTDSPVTWYIAYCTTFDMTRASDIQTAEDVNNRLTELRQEISSNIDQTGEAIKSSVYEKVYLKDDVDTLVSSVSTDIEQTKNSWQATFSQLVQDLNDYSDGSDAAFDEIRKYIRFEDGNILLGNSTSPLILKIRNDRIQFLQNGYEVAYISDQRMYNTTCEIISQLRIADSAWTVETNASGDTVVSLIGI